jgi:hypothetical protein
MWSFGCNTVVSFEYRPTRLLYLISCSLSVLHLQELWFVKSGRLIFISIYIIIHGVIPEGHNLNILWQVSWICSIESDRRWTMNKTGWELLKALPIQFICTDLEGPRIKSIPVEIYNNQASLRLRNIKIRNLMGQQPTNLSNYECKGKANPVRDRGGP